MADTQLLDIPFRGGIDERTNPKWLPVGAKQKAVLNGVFSQNDSIQTRLGFKSITSGARCQRLLSYKNELTMVDGDAFYTLLPTSNQWLTKDLIPACVASIQQVAPASTPVIASDIAEGGGYRVIVWRNGGNGLSGSIFVTVIDLANGAAIYENYPISVGAGIYVNPKVVIANGQATVFYNDGLSNLIAVVLSFSAINSWIGPITVMNSMKSGSVAYDITPIVGTNNAVCAYETNVANHPLGVIIMGLGGGTVSTVVNTVVAGTAANATGYFTIAVRADTSNIWVAWSVRQVGANYVEDYCTFSPTTGAQVLGRTNLHASATAADAAYIMAIEATSSTTCAILWTPTQQALTFAGYVLWETVDNTGHTSALRTLNQVTLASKTCMFNNRVYAMTLFYPPSSIQPTLYLMEFDITGSRTFSRAVATVLPRLAYGPFLPGQVGPPSEPSLIGGMTNQGLANGSYTASCTVGGTTSRNLATSVQAVTFNFNSPTLWMGPELGEALTIACGVPQFYDGVTLGEAAFHYWPDIQSNAVTTTNAGGAVPDGTYSYAVCYEWTDARGQIHRSAPSVGMPVTTAGGGTSQVFVQIPTYAFGTLLDSPTPILLVVYRSSDGGSTYYQCESDRSKYPINNPTLASVSYTDANASVSKNALLYTTGNVLANTSWPSASGMISHKNRLWMFDGAKTLWYSRSYTGGEYPGFSDGLTYTLSDDGVITGLASLDDVLIVFKSDRIFIISGDGPGDTGQGSDLQDQRLASDVGCLDARSIVLTPDGVMFQSAAGIYLLTRAHEVVFIGQPVSNTLATYPTITSAQLSSNSSTLVRFTCTTTPSSSAVNGITIAYDYVAKEWSTHQMVQSGDFGSGTSWITAVQQPGGYYIIARENGQIWQERLPTDAAAYLDINSYVNLQIETPEIHTMGLQGFARIRHVQVNGDYVSPHNLKIEVATDQGAWTSAQSHTWTDDVIQALPREELELRMGNARCGTARFRITVLPPTSGAAKGTGQGVILTGLAIEWVARRGTNRLPPAART